jgi:hypothetical protein
LSLIKPELWCSLAGSIVTRVILDALLCSAARNATQPMISCPDVLIKGCLSLCQPFCLGLDLVLASLGLCFANFLVLFLYREFSKLQRTFLAAATALLVNSL